MGNYALNSYRSLLYTKGSFWFSASETFYQAMNGLINFILTANAWIYRVFDLGLQIFLSNDVFDQTIGSVFTTIIAMYNSLFSSVGILIFLVAIFSIFCVFMFKNPNEALKKMFLLFCIIGINSVIYSNGEQYMKDINHLADDFETQLVKAVKVPTFGENGEIAKETINVGEKSSVDRIREAYFTMAIEQPYSMINFGTVQITEEQEKFLYKENEVAGDKKEKKIEDINGLVKKASEENVYLTPDSIWDKLFISIFSLVNNIFVGGVFLLIAVTKFLLKLLIFCMLFLLPIVSMLSMIPQFGNSLFNALGKILAVFLGGAFISLGLFIFYFIMTLIDYSIIRMAGTVDIVTCILALIVKIIVITLLYKNSGKILSFVTGGRITGNVTIPNSGLHTSDREKGLTEDKLAETEDPETESEGEGNNANHLTGRQSTMNSDEVGRSIIEGFEDSDSNSNSDQEDQTSNDRLTEEDPTMMEPDEEENSETFEYEEEPSELEELEEDSLDIPEQDWAEENEFEEDYEALDLPEEYDDYDEAFDEVELSELPEIADDSEQESEVEPLEIEPEEGVFEEESLDDLTPSEIKEREVIEEIDDKEPVSIENVEPSTAVSNESPTPSENQVTDSSDLEINQTDQPIISPEQTADTHEASDDQLTMEEEVMIHMEDVKEAEDESS